MGRLAVLLNWFENSFFSCIDLKKKQAVHEFAYILKGKCDYHRLKQTVTAYKCQKYCKGNKNTFLDVTYVLVLKEHFCAVHIEVHIYENIFFISF